MPPHPDAEGPSIDAPPDQAAGPARQRVTALLILRSLAFNVAFYLNLVLWILLCMPVMFLKRRTMIRMIQAWARSNLRLMEVLAGTRTEIRGAERIPPGGLLVAAKHQSFWETFALLAVVDDPAFILKRELAWIPFFGLLTWKAGMIPIDRKGGATALAAMNRRAGEAVAAGRQLIIFPEGTRRAPGAPPDYKMGVSHLYRSLGVPCLPMGLNSGWFWSRRQFLRRPGTIVIEILEPIPAGLRRKQFMTLMQDRIEESSDRLLREAEAEASRTGPR